MQAGADGIAPAIAFNRKPAGTHDSAPAGPVVPIKLMKSADKCYSAAWRETSQLTGSNTTM